MAESSPTEPLLPPPPPPPPIIVKYRNGRIQKIKEFFNRPKFSTQEILWEYPFYPSNYITRDWNTASLTFVGKNRPYYTTVHSLHELSEHERLRLTRMADLYGTFTVRSWPGDRPIYATLFVTVNFCNNHALVVAAFNNKKTKKTDWDSSGLDTVYVPVKKVPIDEKGQFTFYEEPFPLVIFNRHEFTVQINYQKRNKANQAAEHPVRNYLECECYMVDNLIQKRLIDEKHWDIDAPFMYRDAILESHAK